VTAWAGLTVFMYDNNIVSTVKVKILLISTRNNPHRISNHATSKKEHDMALKM
jgi:hypothetical protein